jgi:hypothetical protein
VAFIQTTATLGINDRVGYNQVKKDEMGGACSTNGEKRNAYRILVGKLEGKRPLGRSRRRWVDNIKMDLKELEWDGVDWMDMAQEVGLL